MRLICRCEEDSKTPAWGFREEYTVYRNRNHGYIQIMAGYDGELLTEPMLMYNGRLVPLTKRLADKKAATPAQRNAVIQSYIKAKDPIYSTLKDSLIIRIRVWVNFDILEYDFAKAIDYDKSHYTIYRPIDFDHYYDDRTDRMETSIYCKEVHTRDYETPEQAESLRKGMQQVYRMVAASKGNKAQYIYDRCIAQKQKRG